MLFTICARDWLVFYEGKVKESTYLMYYQIAHQLMESLGDQEMEKITNLQLQGYLNGMHRKRYAKSTIQKHRVTVNLIFQYFCKICKGFLNPCQGLYLPKGAHVTKRKPISDEAVTKIYSNFKDIRYLYPLILLAFGLRRSEILPLRWEDFDIRRGVLLVNKTVEYVHNKPILWNCLKNGEEEKIIPILPFLFEYFQELKLKYKQGLVFKNDNGELLLESQVGKLWREFRLFSDIKATQHQFRHTYATILYKAKVDLKTAMELMGHKDVKMLLEIYAHSDDKILKSAINTAGEFIRNDIMQPCLGADCKSVAL